MTKKIFHHVLAVCAVLFSSAAWSATTTTTTPTTEDDEFYIPFLKPGHLVVQIGAFQGIQGEQQHINIQGLEGDTFTVNNNVDYNGLVGLGYFLDGPNLGPVQTSFGVDAFYLGQTSVAGNVIQENIFENLSYSYNVRDIPIYAIAKSMIDLNSSRYVLTIDGGIGPNFMRTSDFQEQSLDGGVTIPDDNLFSSHTTTTFSGTVGVGLRINHAIGPLPVEIGYRFFYLGEGHLSTGNDQVFNTLNTGQTFANALICSVSF